MSLSVRARLILLGSLACAILAAVGLAGVAQLGSFSDATGKSLLETRQGIDALVAVGRADAAFKTQVQEWKNILIRGNDAAQYTRYLKGFEESETAVRAHLALVGKALDTAETRLKLDELGKAHDELGRRYREALNTFDASDPETGKQVDRAVRGMDRAFSEGLAQLVLAIQETQTRNIATQIERAEHTYLSVRNTTLAAIAIGLLIIASLSVLIIRRINHALAGFSETMTRVCRDWDLRLRADTRGNDEITAISAGLNQMLTQFQALVQQINAHADGVQGSASMVSSSVGQITQSVNLLNDATSSAAASIEELTVSINHVRDNASHTLEISRNSATQSEEGGRVIGTTADRMIDTAETVKTAALTVQQLGNQSRDISSIVQVIREVADQTNLLALNAAIEAARAGEQGRGFAVVADEVRKLAERSAIAAREIATKIEEIQHSAGVAVDGMQQIVDQVSEDAELARQAGEAIARIQAGARSVVNYAGDISEALQEQAMASDTLAEQVESIARSSDENTAALQQTSTTVIDLEHMATEMRKAVSRFAT